MYWFYRRAYSFRVSEPVFRLALLLDAQRWKTSPPRVEDLSFHKYEFFFFGERSWTVIDDGKTYFAPVGLRTAIIKLLKAIGEWEPWRGPRPTPVWEVAVYGMRHRFARYMTPELLAALIHEHHTTVKGTTHWWCLHCNPSRGGGVQDIGALEAADDFISVVQGRPAFE